VLPALGDFDMLKINMDFRNFADQQGSFQINETIYQFRLQWNFVSENWMLGITTPTPGIFFEGIKFSPNTPITRNLGLQIFPDNGDLILLARDGRSDAPQNFQDTQNNFDLLYLNGDEVREWRKEHYGI
jgi:hypothetical protein